MELNPNIFSNIESINDICYIEQRYHSNIYELPVKNESFCIFFTAICYSCFDNERKEILLEKMTIVNADIKYEKGVLRLATYKKSYYESGTETVKGRIGKITLHPTKLFIKINDVTYKYILKKDFLIHKLYTVAYSYKFGIDVELKIKFSENDAQNGYIEVVDIIPNLEILNDNFPS